ncbi:MAG: hypothetical protein OEU94_08235 [Aquincola sp.]|nr:hypothetical protein [Aquincola sp.]MDH4287669.1 hypothetical protein [Aquincola sp.]MDH5328334.1 hypothetical protein [Aquincola sp.]
MDHTRAERPPAVRRLAAASETDVHALAESLIGFVDDGASVNCEILDSALWAVGGYRDATVFYRRIT